MAAVLVRGESSQGELLVELVNAPGATRRVRRPQVGLECSDRVISGLHERGARLGVVASRETMAWAPSHFHLHVTDLPGILQ